MRITKKHAEKCIVCGRRLAKPIKFPAGQVDVCTDYQCRDELVFRCNDNSVPVVSFSLEDLRNHEVIDEEILDHFKPAAAMDLAPSVGDFIWGGQTLGEMLHDAIVEAGQTLEKNFVSTAKPAELVLKMDKLRSEEAIKLLEQRLKGPYLETKPR